MSSTVEQRVPDCTRIVPWILALVISAGALWVDVTAKEWASEALAEPVRITLPNSRPANSGGGH